MSCGDGFCARDRYCGASVILRHLARHPLATIQLTCLKPSRLRSCHRGTSGQGLTAHLAAGDRCDGVARRRCSSVRSLRAGTGWRGERELPAGRRPGAADGLPGVGQYRPGQSAGRSRPCRGAPPCPGIGESVRRFVAGPITRRAGTWERSRPGGMSRPSTCCCP